MECVHCHNQYMDGFLHASQFYCGHCYYTTITKYFSKEEMMQKTLLHVGMSHKDIEEFLLFFRSLP